MAEATPFQRADRLCSEIGDIITPVPHSSR